jgi:hypothetical protein
MRELETLMKDVDLLKNKLEALNDSRNIDSEVLAASKLFNASLFQYNKVIGEKINEVDNFFR